ncbi:LacI family DNA-binding transcriptional regulator [Terricaulis silvestris]|nr:substrate-binding domain-containing protein [Terricaulis silvestris]
MDDIARLAKVSKPTVSRALQDSPLVNAATKERIIAIAVKHGYSVNRNAQRLRTRRSSIIAVVLHLPQQSGRAVAAPFIFQLLADVSRALSIRNQDLLLCSAESDEAHAYERMLASKGVDGFIFLGQGTNGAWLSELAKTNAPFVVWGAVDDTQPYCAVGSDNLAGGVLAGRRFAQLGRTRALFIGNRAHAEMDLRRRGLEAGLKEGRSIAAVIDLEIADFSYETAYQAMKEKLAGKRAQFDAVFAGSDIVAMAALVALREAGLRTPEDVSVIGYNDIPFAAHVSPPLTTIRQDTHQAGALLVEKLFQILDGARPKSVTLPTELIVRQT